MTTLRTVFGREAIVASLLGRRPFSEPELSADQRARMTKVFGRDLPAAAFVAAVFDEVGQTGCAGLERITTALQAPWRDPIFVQGAEITAALNSIGRQDRRDLEFAAERIRDFHAASMPDPQTASNGGCRQIMTAVASAGIYAPGGRAAYPSSLLMTAIPARVAGVTEVVVASPPGADGQINPIVLAAAAIAEVDLVLALGGAQAIAALALGADPVPQTDVVTGPGNIFVVLALRHAVGIAGVACLPGPTETLLIADDGANPVWVAADLLAQAEHDPMASALLLTDSRPLAKAVTESLEHQLKGLPRAAIARASLESNGGIGVVATLAEAAELANTYAPEHLCLLGARASALAGRITAAGGLFVGEQSPEVLGDYVAGPSHVMPVGGTARFASPVSVYDFLKRINVFELDEAQARALAPAAARLARLEGLEAHARAAQLRIE